MNSINYQEVGPDFHDKLLKSKNPLRRWFHNRRLEILRTLILKYRVSSEAIVDIGCGSCTWNIDNLAVIGVDINEESLKYAKRLGRLETYRVADLKTTGFGDETSDMVVCAEVLEHVDGYKKVIREIYRILKPKGIAVVSLPYDTFWSFWRPLFIINCLIEGYLLGKSYFKNRGGHINHFSPAKLRTSFSQEGFEIIEDFGMKRFTIFMVVKKP